jgi:hypothetical protein
MMDTKQYVIVKETTEGGPLTFTKLRMGSSREEYDKKADELGGIVVCEDDLPECTDPTDLRLQKGKIVVDVLPKANRIMNGLRGIRNQKLRELDLISMRAIEDGDMDKLKKIKEKKDELRDLPQVVGEKLQKIIDAPKKKYETKLKDISKIKIQIKDLEN